MVDNITNIATRNTQLKNLEITRDRSEIIHLTLGKNTDVAVLKPFSMI